MLRFRKSIKVIDSMPEIHETELSKAACCPTSYRPTPVADGTEAVRHVLPSTGAVQYVECIKVRTRRLRVVIAFVFASFQSGNTDFAPAGLCHCRESQPHVIVMPASSVRAGLTREMSPRRGRCSDGVDSGRARHHHGVRRPVSAGCYLLATASVLLQPLSIIIDRTRKPTATKETKCRAKAKGGGGLVGTGSEIVGLVNLSS
jgi:hypothetical protein